MIRGMASSPSCNPGFPSAWRWLPALGAGVLVLTAGCLPERHNTLYRTARMREVETERLAAERAERELVVLRQRAADARQQIGAATERSIVASAELRAVLVQLEHQLAVLGAAEQDLAAARQRAEAIGQELQPLRALEGSLQDVAQRQQALQAQLAAAEAELATRQQDVAARQAQLATQLQAVQQQRAALEPVEAALRAAQAAAQALVPPPAAPPASDPSAAKKD